MPKGDISLDRSTRRAWERILGKIEKQFNSTIYQCLVPGCTRNAIGSHSQQKAGQLHAIARNGQVYALERNLYKAFKGQYWQDSILLLTPAGLKEASVFPGYCAPHDALLFEPIEKRAFCQNDPEQAYCLFLRALSYEFSQKRRMTSLLRSFGNEAKAKGLPFDHEYFNYYLKGMEYFLIKDAPYYFHNAFNVDGKTVKDWLMWSWRVIPKRLGASCTCCFSPLQSHHDSYMAAHFGEPQPLLAFSLIPQLAETHVVLCWHRQHTKLVEPLEAKLHDADYLEEFINECALVESEDTCFNPDLWESASEAERLAVLNAMRHRLFRGPLDKIPRLIRL